MPRHSQTRPDDPIALNLAKIVFVLLTNPRGWRVSSLMEELGIKPRTYRKYKSLLRQQFDFLFDPEGKSAITEVRDGEERWLRLRDTKESLEQEQSDFYTRVVTMELARQVFGFLRGSEMDQHAADQRTDFFTRIGDRNYVYRELLRGMNRKVFYLSPPPKDYSGHARTLQTLIKALFFHRRIYAEYTSACGVSTKVLEPLTLILWNGGLYLVARSRGSRTPRLYVVDRFRDVRGSHETFRYPSEQEYSPQRYCDGHFGIFHEEREPVEVELVFAAKRWLHLFLTERLWHPTQSFQTLPDGRLRMTFYASCLVEVGRFVRSFGDDVEVVKPDRALLRAPEREVGRVLAWKSRKPA